MDYLDNLELRSPASQAHIDQVRQLGALPEDYLNFLRLSNGAAGWVGENYLILYNADQVCAANNILSELTRGIIVFGSDGGDLKYAFDPSREEETIVEIYGMDLGFEQPKFCAHSMAEFFKYVHDKVE